MYIGVSHFSSWRTGQQCGPHRLAHHYRAVFTVHLTSGCPVLIVAYVQFIWTCLFTCSVRSDPYLISATSASRKYLMCLFRLQIHWQIFYIHVISTYPGGLNQIWQYPISCIFPPFTHSWYRSNLCHFRGKKMELGWTMQRKDGLWASCIWSSWRSSGVVSGVGSDHTLPCLSAHSF